MISKKELRKEILKRRDAMTLEERASQSHEIAKRVIEQKCFQEADKVLLFASFKSEVDTNEIFHTARTLSKDVYYPKVVGEEMEFYLVENLDELVEGYRGIREPREDETKRLIIENKICVIMPGAVFDEEGNRIGYGGGYYDRFLQRLEMPEVDFCKIAIAFDCQMVEKGFIPCEEHDIEMDCIVTEKQNIFIKNWI